MDVDRTSQRHARRIERRNAGLGRIRSLTAGVAVGAVAGAGILAGYFSHAVPGRHAAGGTPSSVSTGSGNSGAVQNSGNSGGAGNSGVTGSSGGFSAPAAPPQPSQSRAQVVSGSS